MLGMKLALPRFVARGEGHLINIASAAGKGPYPGGATYCGTKHFVVGVSETVRGELRGTGVDLSVVMPVVVDTELASGLGTAAESRWSSPKDVAAAIVETLRRPRFDVYVPRSIGPAHRAERDHAAPPARVHDARRSGPTACSGSTPPSGPDTRSARPARSRPCERRRRAARAVAVAPLTGPSRPPNQLNGPLGVRRQVRLSGTQSCSNGARDRYRCTVRWTDAMDCSHAHPCA